MKRSSRPLPPRAAAIALLVVAPFAIASDDEAPSSASKAQLPAWAAAYERHALEHRGDPRAGEALFTTHEGLRCTKCHRVTGMERAGPNLDGVGDKFARADLVREVLLPSASIKPGFEQVTLALRDGSVLTGRVERANRVVYRIIDADGKQTDVDRAQVVSAVVGEASLMPADLVRAIAPGDFTDLIAYLETLRFGIQEGIVASGQPISITRLPAENEARFEPIHPPELRFENPVWCGALAGTPRDLVVVEQHSSRVWLLVRGDGPPRKELFLDIAAATYLSGNQGLMCVAFHPRYAENRRYFLEYEVKENDEVKTTVVERRASDDGLADSGDASRRLLEVVQPAYNHNGGCIAFGADGMLYAAFGDGGPQRDPPGYAQNPRIFLGSMLRVDVDRRDPGLAYAIPPDNPFLEQHAIDAAIRPETWAIGFREPWRFSFDAATGDLWLGDVGQDEVEEVAIVRRGENHGWNVREGFQEFSNEYRRAGETYTDPLFAYRHGLGFSVTGGHVYRGRRSPSFAGVYIFGDYNTRRVWGLRQHDGRVERVVELGTAPGGVASFGVDQEGEIFLVTYAGTVYAVDLSRAEFPGS